MPRVASYSHNQSLLQGLLRNQGDLYKVQQQINTGKKAQDYRGIASDASTVVSARAAFTRTQAYQNTAKEVGQTLSLVDLQLGSMLDNAQSVKDAILGALALGDGQGFMDSIEASFGMIASSLNTKVGNSYLFAGGQTGEKPFAVGSLNDLVALPSVDDAFANDQNRASVRLTDTFTMQYGILADEVAKPLMEAFRVLQAFNNGADGPIDGTLTPQQVSFLESQISVIDSAVKSMRSVQVSNGLRQSQIEDVTTQLDQQGDYFETFISDIEDVNMAEAITRFNNDQAALEASYRVIGMLSQLNLSKYI